jgi:hypothetical protein
MVNSGSKHNEAFNMSNCEIKHFVWEQSKPWFMGQQYCDQYELSQYGSLQQQLLDDNNDMI